MTASRTFAFVLALVMGVSLTGGRAQAQSWQHVDELAWQLRSKTSRLARELRYDYRHAPQYEHLYSDAVQMYRLSDHIHEIIHHGEDLDHVAEDVRQLDTLFHHIEELVDEMEGGGYHEHGLDDGLHGSHYDHLHSYTHTHLLRVRLSSIERTLHHLLEDVEHLASGPAIHSEPVFVPRPDPTITFGGRRFSIRLGN